MSGAGKVADAEGRRCTADQAESEDQVTGYRAAAEWTSSIEAVERLVGGSARVYWYFDDVVVCQAGTREAKLDPKIKKERQENESGRAREQAARGRSETDVARWKAATRTSRNSMRSCWSR